MRRAHLWTGGWRAVLLAAALVLGPVIPVWAQAGGVLVGVIDDVQGSVIPGATLTLSNMETGVTRSTVSEGDGRYRFAALPPGRYELVAELSGFASVRVRDVVFTIGLELRRDVTMDPRGIEETVTVVAEAPVVNTTSSEVAGLITQQQIATLPVNTRQYLSLALLMPGTSQDAARSYLSNVTIASGGLFYSSHFLVDGVSNNETLQGEPRQDFPQGAVQEFKVNTTQFKAQYGWSNGGLVTIVTKSGTNLFSGEAFEFFRDKSLNTRNKFEQARYEQFGDPKPAFRRNLYGGSFGGPIVKDRTHFFASVQRTKTELSKTVNTGKPALYSSVEGTFPAPQFQNIYFGRVDHQINLAQTVFARYTWEPERKMCQGCGGNVANTGSTDFQMPRKGLVIGHTWVISPKAVNEFRFQWATFEIYEYASGTPIWEGGQGEWPESRMKYLTRAYVFPSLRYGSSGSQIAASRWWEFKDEVAIDAGRHGWRFGVNVVRTPAGNDFAANAGTYTFATDQPFNPNDPATIANLKNPINFSATVPGVFTEVTSWRFVGFAQDDWQLSPRLTASLGLRYDMQTGVFNAGLDPTKFTPRLPYVDPSRRGDRNNFAPRLGFAWDTRGDGKSVVRGGAGIYYNAVRVMQSFQEKENLRRFSIVIPNPPYPDPYLGQDPLVFASTAPPNITIFSNEMQNPYARELSAGYSQQLGGDLGISIDAVYTTVRRDNQIVDINAPDPITGRRPDPTWGQINEYQPISNAKYRALYLRLNKRYANRYQYLVSYTLAKSDDNSWAYGRVTDVRNLDLDWGPSNVDRRHTLVASGSTLLPADITIGAVWSLRSTRPFSAIAGRDLNRNGFVTDYVPGTSRNQGRRDLDLNLVNTWRAQNGLNAIQASQIKSSRFNSVDVRVAKMFRLSGRAKVEILAQVFNVFGTDNLQAGFVTNALSDAFGTITSADPRQQAELGIQFRW